eukprot:TRINITY_DN17914_c0_g1_i1.p1 TRINITY_DN17914_c0_g1~~TRINITY_DN17914_c0_g1_i1.p1  ORF type:complete len:510 (-),score=66.28 TRINITY_DN17914_c0_g1_i1:52-1467(-)
MASGGSARVVSSVGLPSPTARSEVVVPAFSNASLDQLRQRKGRRSARERQRPEPDGNAAIIATITVGADAESEGRVAADLEAVDATNVESSQTRAAGGIKSADTSAAALGETEVVGQAATTAANSAQEMPTLVASARKRGVEYESVLLIHSESPSAGAVAGIPIRKRTKRNRCLPGAKRGQPFACSTISKQERRGSADGGKAGGTKGAVLLVAPSAGRPLPAAIAALSGHYAQTVLAQASKVAATKISSDLQLATNFVSSARSPKHFASPYAVCDVLPSIVASAASAGVHPAAVSSRLASKERAALENLDGRRCVRPQLQDVTQNVSTASATASAEDCRVPPRRAGTNSAESGETRRSFEDKRVSFASSSSIEVHQFSVDPLGPETSRGPRRVFGGDLQAISPRTAPSLPPVSPIIPLTLAPGAGDMKTGVRSPLRLPGLTVSAQDAQLQPPLCRPGIRDLAAAACVDAVA